MTKVSVVIPTYKRSEFLLRALESVLGQTWTDIEAVIVDDNGEGSEYRAATQKSLDAHYGSDPRVKRVLNAKNMGGALARNEGIKAASGEYITFLDDDDIFLPNKVQVQVEAMMANGWEMSFMDCDIHNQDGVLVDQRRHPVDTHPKNEDLLIRHLVDPLTPTDTYMYRAEALRRIGMFDDVLTAQEYLLMLKSINSGLKIGYIKQSLVVQYIHDGERMSFGKNKVTGELYLLSVKKKYFHLLTGKQRRFIVCRHHAVLFFACLKRREYASALKHMVLAGLTSPAIAINIFLDKVRMLRVDPLKKNA
ncbi:MAG: glycosyltransferase family 2 protein [Clostridia bacterium]|nr:glycosyltransferase family 2 protein [Clostridia bacterium]